MFDKDLLPHLKNLSDWVEQSSPEAAEILGKLRQGELSPEEATLRLAKTVSENQEMFSQAAHEFLAPLREGGDGPPRTYSPKPGIESLNPALEASLMERAQFDGDVPEHRTGVLAEGVMPAVAVETTSLDPVVIGWQLEQASQEVQNRINQALEERSTSLVPVKEVTGVVGYEAGKEPEALSIPCPDMTEVSTWGTRAQQEYAWATLSTTQGRRSAAAPLLGKVVEILQQDGFDVAGVRGTVSDSHAQWISNIPYQGNIQPKYAYLEVAAQRLASDLAGSIRNRGLSDAPLKVVLATVDDVAHRRVGWVASVHPRGEV